MKKFKFIYVLIALVGLYSCEKDLNIAVEDPLNTTPDILFSTPEGYKQALAGVYGNLVLTGTGGAGSSFLEGIDAGTSQFGRCLWYLQNLTTDEVIWSYENDEGTKELNRNTWTASNPILLGMYSRTMAEVAFANDFLRQSTPEKLNSRGITNPTDVANIQDYRNEVRVLRAYAYYNMMDLFGKAAMITENDPLDFKGPENNRQQLFTFIENELNAVLPSLKPARTNEYGRLDKAFAQMILAKMYLNAQVYIGTAKYSECVTQLNAIIASGYTLNPNYLNNFKADNHTSSEMIFTLQSDGVATQNYGATTVIINGQVGSVENNGSDFGVGGWGGALRLRRQFVEKFQGISFDYDARKTIISGSRPIDIADIANKGQGFVLAKFSNKTSGGISGVSGTFVDTDFPLFRLADAYLMYAECYLRGASNANAVDALYYVNLLRERANGGNFANITAGELNLNFILDERSRELHWEAHRRQDLIRFGKYTGGSYNWAWKGNGMNGVAIASFRSVFPIPTNSLSANPNLTQNTGY